MSHFARITIVLNHKPAPRTVIYDRVRSVSMERVQTLVMVTTPVRFGPITITPTPRYNVDLHQFSQRMS